MTARYAIDTAIELEQSDAFGYLEKMIGSGGGVYALANLQTADCYVGSSVNMRRRCSDHLRDLAAGKHPNWLLQKAWDAFGPSVVKPIMLQSVSDAMSLLKAEQRWIDRFGRYNICLVAGRPPSQRGNHTPKKLSDAGREQLRENGRRTKGSQAWNKGLSTSLETRERLRLAHLGQKLKPETLAKIIAANTGQKRSAEFRERMRVIATERERLKRARRTVAS